MARSFPSFAAFDDVDDPGDRIIAAFAPHRTPGPAYHRPVSPTFVKRVLQRQSGFSLPALVLVGGFR